MPDIAMCANSDCPSRNKCYRYTATPNEYRQAYMSAPVLAQGAIRCDYFVLDMRQQHITEQTREKQP